ncbi:MAG TPA: hypothetical protein VMM79_01500 [Longimicrobiales bacterium]|nr:hypothetical protein [Longimicrobiales bacterium]
MSGRCDRISSVAQTATKPRPPMYQILGHDRASPALWWTPPARRLMILRIGESVETQESD